MKDREEFEVILAAAGIVELSINLEIWRSEDGEYFISFNRGERIHLHGMRDHILRLAPPPPKEKTVDEQKAERIATAIERLKGAGMPCNLSSIAIAAQATTDAVRSWAELNDPDLFRSFPRRRERRVSGQKGVHPWSAE